MGGPVGWIRDAIDGKVGFDFLIETFCCSIRLVMEGSGHCGLDSKGFYELLKNLQGETRIMIGDQFVRESKMFEQIGYK